MVLGVLVVVDEDGPVRALLLPPLRRREALAAALDLARQRDRRPADGRRSPTRRVDAHRDVHATRARRARIAAQAVLLQDVAHEQRDPPHRVPRRARHRIDVDAQLVRVVEVEAPDRVRVEVDVAQGDRPDEVRGVDRHELLGGVAGGKRQHRRLQPLRPLRRHALLVEGLGLDPAGVALQDGRPLAQMVQDGVRAVDVEVRELALRHAAGGEVDLVRAGELDLHTVEREDLVLRGRHAPKPDTMRAMAVPERPVLVAPDSFKGTFNAAQVAGAIGRGLERAGLMPPDLCPVADGGEGTLDALLPQLGGELLAVDRPRPARQARPHRLRPGRGRRHGDRRDGDGLRPRPRARTTNATPGTPPPTAPAS